MIVIVFRSSYLSSRPNTCILVSLYAITAKCYSRVYQVKLIHFHFLGDILFTVFGSCTWLSFLLLLAGDIHRNPGPSALTSISSLSSLSKSISNSLFSSLLVYLTTRLFIITSKAYFLKMVREKSRECHNHKPQPFQDPKRKRKPTNLNKHKPDTLYAELYEFDILAFYENWLSPSVDPTYLLLESYCESERKDRPGDKHVIIIIYSWLSLSRPRLSRITAYLEAKIWSLPIHENLTTDGKYCRKEEKLLLRSNFSSFPQYF